MQMQVNWIDINSVVKFTQSLKLTDFRELAQIVQAFATVVAIIVGGIWFVTKRKNYPRAGIEHQVSFRIIKENDYNEALLSIFVTIVNKGDVLLKLTSVKLEVYQVLPPPMHHLIKKPSFRKGKQIVGWYPINDVNDLNDTELIAKKQRVMIEPGENLLFDRHYAINSDIQTVLVKSVVQNPKIHRLNWKLITIHDLR